MKKRFCIKCEDYHPEDDKHFSRQRNGTFLNVCRVCKNEWVKAYKKRKAEEMSVDNYGVMVVNNKPPFVEDDGKEESVTNCKTITVYCHNKKDGCKRKKKMLFDMNDKRRPRYVCPYCQEYGSPPNRLTESG